VIQRYIAGRLPEDDLTAFEEHLVLCSDCQGEVALAVAVRDALAEMASRGESSHGSAGRLVPGDRPRRSRHGLAAAAALFFTIAAGWWLRAALYDTGDDLPVRKIAVLPFEVASSDLETNVLAFGLRNDLQADMRRLRSLELIGDSTASAMRGVRLSELVEQAGVAIEADLLLGGTAVVSRDSLRFNLELRASDGDSPLWGGEYRIPARSFVSLALLPKLILTDLVERGLIHASAAERRHLEVSAGVSEEVVRTYYEGLYLLRLGDESGIGRGVELLEEVVSLDPEFARAHSLLSTAYVSAVYNGGLSAEEGFTRAIEEAREAISLDDQLAEAYGSLGWSLAAFEWDWPSALDNLSRGYEVDPENELAALYYSFVLALTGHESEAIRIAEKAAGLDPLNLPVLNHLGTVHLLARHYGVAIEHFQKVLELKPDFFFTLQWLPLAYSSAGKHDQAVTEARQAAEMSPWLRGYLALVLARAGGTAEAEAIATQLSEEAARGTFPFASNLAAVYGALGDIDRAFELLEAAVENRSDPALITLRASPEFDELRADARFEKVLAQVGLD
jgi:tetratricopeptide (TPR) repeat protein/TolB-like protein